MSVTVDKHEITLLANDLKKNGAEALDEVYEETRTSMRKINDHAQNIILAGGYAHLPHLHRSFTWEVTKNTSSMQAEGEAGAEWERLQGRLDVFIEFGTPTSSDHPHWRPAADAEIPLWEDRCERAVTRGLE